MDIELDIKEREKLRAFLINNAKWLETKDLSNKQNLIELINKYGAYLEDNNLSFSRNLLMLLIELKKELTRLMISPNENRTKSDLTNWKKYYDKIVISYKENQYKRNDLDAITNMLAQKIQSREENKRVK